MLINHVMNTPDTPIFKLGPDPVYMYIFLLSFASVQLRPNDLCQDVHVGRQLHVLAEIDIHNF